MPSMINRIGRFAKVLIFSIVSISIMLSICGGLMYLVDRELDSFIAGVILGAIFGAGLIIMFIIYTITAFIDIFKNA